MQTINLYKFIPEKQREYLTFNNLLIFYCLFLILLFLSYMLDIWELHEKKIELAHVTAELDQVKNHLTALRTKYPLINPKDIQGSLLALERSLESKNKIVGILLQKIHFSDYLVGLAQAINPDVWLTDIDISLIDANINLKGFTSNTNMLHIFVQNLKKEKNYSSFPLTIKTVANQHYSDEKAQVIAAEPEKINTVTSQTESTTKSETADQAQSTTHTESTITKTESVPEEVTTEIEKKSTLTPNEKYLNFEISTPGTTITP